MPECRELQAKRLLAQRAFGQMMTVEGMKVSNSEQFHHAYVIAIDDKFIDPFAVFLSSLVKHSPFASDVGLVLLYDSHSLSKAGFDRIGKTILSKYQFNCLLIDCHDIIPSTIKWQPSDHVSKATYYRLFFFDLLPASVRKAVYLDIDMVVTADISDLFNIAFAQPIAAVNHHSGADEVRLWGPAGGGYFNAGLIVFDVSRIKTMGCVRRYVEILETMSDRILWHDQDVLNIAHENNWHHLPWFYNLTRCAIIALSPSSSKDFKIVHYDGWNKPWVTGCVRPYEELWQQAHRELHGHHHATMGWLTRSITIARVFRVQLKALWKDMAGKVKVLFATHLHQGK